MYNIDSYYDLKDLFDVKDISNYIFKVNYTNADYETNEFLITDIQRSDYGPKYFDASCIDEDGNIEEIIEGDFEEDFVLGLRTFKISRLNDIKLVRRL